MHIATGHLITLGTMITHLQGALLQKGHVGTTMTQGERHQESETSVRGESETPTHGEIENSIDGEIETSVRGEIETLIHGVIETLTTHGEIENTTHGKTEISMTIQALIRGREDQIGVTDLPQDALIIAHLPHGRWTMVHARVLLEAAAWTPT